MNTVKNAKDAIVFENHVYEFVNEEPAIGDWAIQYDDVGLTPMELFKVEHPIPGECVVKKIYATSNEQVLNDNLDIKLALISQSIHFNKK